MILKPLSEHQATTMPEDNKMPTESEERLRDLQEVLLEDEDHDINLPLHIALPASDEESYTEREKESETSSEESSDLPDLLEMDTSQMETSQMDAILDEETKEDGEDFDTAEEDQQGTSQQGNKIE